ncbi:hypothetical protein HO173_009148 [Letharia columbiana]|uniref:Major facilitator superfamily (MFS) profile domain-containing protein n=1 Tax=Letharia columbiana TaxID=112416 RepID=A0A8H6FQ93_9LECA|nr:uncharacterized protein HO173_009148 [Letharia columbiana]KAF6232709.1 hypothetical protein HO173_009148 [Letharia columbiana]
MGSDSGLEVGPAINTNKQGDLEGNFELKDLTGSHNGSRCSSSTFDPEFEEAHSDEEEKSPSFLRSRRASASTLQSSMLYTPDEEKSVIRKFDRRLVLFVALLYMLSFLDRSNIGNARIAGLSEDLHLSSLQYEWLLRAFYITYILFEWMTLLWKVFPPHIYLSVCVASWGLIASMQSVAFSFISLFILRAALGIGEAAFVGIPFFMSFFYQSDELAFRTGLFISAAPLATSFASSLAWVITKIGNHVPIADWRLLFLVEGFPSVFVAVFVFLYIPDNPETARYLTRREQKVAKLRLRKETAGREAGKGGLKWSEIRETLIDPKSFLTAAMFFCSNVAFSSLPVFLPTIIKEMGYSALTSQALSAPPYLAAFFTVLSTAYYSDRYRTRSAFVIFHAFLASFGYAMMAIAGSVEASAKWRYIGVYPAAMGFFSVVTIVITWTINNQDSDSKKATGVAMLNYIGQLGPLVGVHLYPDSDQPYYVKGMAICACFMATVAVLALALRWILDIKNRRMAAEDSKADGEDEGLVVQNGTDRGRRQFMFML